MERAGREGKDGWVVGSRSRGPDSAAAVVSEVYDAVVVCNGHFTEPQLAEVPGTVLPGSVTAEPVF